MVWSCRHSAGRRPYRSVPSPTPGRGAQTAPVTHKAVQEVKTCTTAPHDPHTTGCRQEAEPRLACPHCATCLERTQSQDRSPGRPGALQQKLQGRKGSEKTERKPLVWILAGLSLQSSGHGERFTWLGVEEGIGGLRGSQAGRPKGLRVQTEAPKHRKEPRPTPACPGGPAISLIPQPHSGKTCAFLAVWSLDYSHNLVRFDYTADITVQENTGNVSVRLDVTNG